MIHLVQMPFGSVERPSLALGLLKASLSEAGLTCDVTYANLAYAERIGLELYLTVELTRSEELTGEWIFSRAAFREDALPDQPYLDRLRDRFAPLFPSFSRLRADAPDFVAEMAARVLATRPRLLGVSSTFQQHCASLALLRAVKELDPSVVTIIGGANCEAAMGKALVRNFPWVDYAVSGEADELFPRFCREVLEGCPQPAEGLFHRDWDTPADSRATVASLEMLPRPDFDDYFRALDAARWGRIEPGLVVETSRGCWWGAKHHCTFCGLNGGGMGYRSKSAPRALEELEALAARYGVKRFQVADNILAMAHLKTLLPELSGKGYSLFYETKANLKRAQVETLARAGVRWIQPGIESLHDAILDLMDKGATALVNVQLLRHAREFGVRLSWNFLSCFPGEDPRWSAEMCEWLPRVFHLQPPSANVRVRYDRFSPYHSRPEHYGLELEPYPHYAHVYPLPAAELRDLAYFFDDLDPSGRSMERPEYRRLNELVGEWRAAWAGLPPLLTLEDDGERVEIYDSRPGSAERFYVLEEPLREALLACESPQSGLTPEVLAELERRRLVLVQNGKALSLAVPGSVPTLPDLCDFPGGNFTAQSWSRQYQGKGMTLVEAGRYLQAGNLTAAQDLYRRSLEEHPLQGHIGLGDAHFAAGEHRQAFEHYYAVYQRGLRTANLRQAMLVSLFHHPLGPPEMDMRAFLEEALEWPDVDVQWALRAALYVIAGNFTVEEPLLRQVLRRCSLNTREQEEKAAGLRASLQQRPDPAWCAAMAWQSAFNEYLFEATPEEEARLGEVTNEEQWLVHAMYQDPNGFPRVALGPLGQELYDELVMGRERERAFELPRVGAGCTSETAHVRAQYEEHPYPRWRNLYGCRQMPLSQWVPGGGPEVAAPEVLIAGAGTGQEPLTWAARGPSARITAVDISAASLAYGWRRSQELGLPVEFVHADILELGNLGRQFDLVASSGVLHHLPDPAAGLRVLAGLLRPGGVMKLALYSRQAREGISAAQRLVAGMSLRAARRKLLDLPDDDPAKQPTRFLDFYYLSGCRDMLFHAQEHLFDLAGIASAVGSCGLKLIGLEVPSAVARTYSALFPEDLHRTNLHNWGVYEKLYPSTFELMYQFWCRKEATC